jgi:hypothetical protein
MIPALLEILRLPYYVYLFSQVRGDMEATSPYMAKTASSSLIEGGLNAIVQLIVGVFFWRCGPLVENSSHEWIGKTSKSCRTGLALTFPEYRDILKRWHWEHSSDERWRS